MRGRSAEVLDGPTGWLAEGGSSMERPVGIAEHFASEEDEIGLSFGDDGVGLMGIGDHADGGCRDGGFGADARGEGYLVAGAEGDGGMGDETAGGAIDQVDATGAELPGERDGVVDGPTIFGPVGCGDTDEEGQVGGPDGAHGVNNLEGKAGAVLEAAAIGVGALVGEGREEFVEQVAVGRVDFDDVEASGGSAPGRLLEGANDGVDAVLRKGLRNGIVRGKRDCARGDGVPSALLGGDESIA